MTDRPLLTRRRVLLACAGIAAAGAAGVIYARTDRFTGLALSPTEVLAQVDAGAILLVDIRRPDEWQATGLARGAVPLDLRRPDFVPRLRALAEGDTARPIALICARGVRSDRTGARLVEAGFTNIIDVPEGMLGSSAGPGWLARGLPVVRP